MNRSAPIAALLLLTASAAASAYQWPIFPFNQQHVILSTIGDIRVSSANPAALPSLHTGVDIQASVGSLVYPVVSGYVTQVDANAQSITVGSFKYQLIDLSNVDLQPGDPAFMGGGTQQTLLGTVFQASLSWQEFHETADDGFPTHLHFEDGLNPVNSGLTPYSDTSDPFVGSIQVVRDTVPNSTMVTGVPFPSVNGMQVISGFVDIKTLGDTRDRGVAADGAVTTSSMSVYQYGYRVLLFPSNQELFSNYPCTFNSPAFMRPEMVYAAPTDKMKYSYWLTNSCNSHGAWNTQDSIQGVPDGIYRIQALVRDTQNSAIYGRPSYVVSSTITVIVDNNPPVANGFAPVPGSSVGTHRPQILAALTDAGSGIASADLRIDGIQSAHVGGSATSISFTPSIDLSSGPHTALVFAIDRSSPTRTSTTTWTFTVVDDTSPPSIPTVIADGVFTNDPTGLHASWAATDADTGISTYFVAIGTSASGQEVSPFTSFGPATSGRVGSLNLSMGSTYFVSVYAVNGSGLVGGVGSSQGILVTNSRPIASAGGPYGGFALNPITLDGTMSFDGDGDTVTYRWTFGDGFTSNVARPIHTYSAAGAYSVTLIVNDGYSDSVPSTATVNVVHFLGIPHTWTTAGDFASLSSTKTQVVAIASSIPDDADVQLQLGPEFLAIDQSSYTLQFNAFQYYSCSYYPGQFRVALDEYAATTTGALLTRFSPLLRRTGHPINATFFLQNQSVPIFHSDVGVNTSSLGSEFAFVDIPLTNLPVSPFDQVQMFDNTNPQASGNPGGDYYEAGASDSTLPNSLGVFASVCDPQLFGIPAQNHAWAFRLYGRAYPSSGWVYSSPFDIGTDSVSYGPFTATDSKPVGLFAYYHTSIDYFTQSSADGINWDPAIPVTPGQFVQSTPRRFIRWSANLLNNDQSKTPIIHDVTLSFHTYDPPGAPTQLIANGASPSAWTSQSTFTITMTPPTHSAGIAGAHFKSGGLPNSSSDGVFVPGTTSFTYYSPSLTNGSNALFVWLEDTLGNSSTNFISVAYLRFDSVPPDSIAVAPSTAANGPFPVSFDSTDVGTNAVPPTGSGVSDTYLWYRRDHGGDGVFGTWQRISTEFYAGGVSESTGTFSFNPESYDTVSPDGVYQFYTQGRDTAGNFEAQPLSTSIAKATTYFDRSPPVISNVIPLSVMSTSALLQWKTNEPATGYVDYGTTTAFGYRVDVSTFATSQLATLNCQLLYPATIYYRITAVNLTQLTTLSSTFTLTTPIQVTIPADPFGVVTNGNSIVIQINNPEISTGTFDINGEIGNITLSSSGAFLITLSTSVVGTQTLNINIGGAVFSTQFVVDSATRTVRLARFVVDAGGVMTSTETTPGTSLLDMTAGQAVQGPPTDLVAQGSFVSGRSRLFGGYYAGIDPVPPSGITDLGVVPGPGRGQAILSWSAVGDDEDIGQAMLYDLRYSTIPINSQADFLLAGGIILSTYPAASGTTQQALVTGLNDETTYYFALEALDEGQNASSLSNAASTTTYAVAQSTNLLGGKPTVALISNVSGIAIDQVSTTTFNPSVVLATSAAAAEGLLFASPVYDILSPVNPLPGGATIEFRFDSTDLDPALQQQLRIYHFISSQSAWVLLSDAPPIVNDNLLIAEVNSFSMYAIMLRDRAAPITTLSYLHGRQFAGTGGSIFVSTATSYELNAADPPLGNRPGTGVATTQYRIDGATMAISVPGSTTAAFTLAPGLHTLEYFSADYSGNVESTQSVSISVDNAPPTYQIKAATGPYALLADGISMPTPTLFVALHDPLLPSGSADAGAGLSSAAFTLDGSSFAVFGSSFSLTLATGTHFLEILAEDNVGNILDRSSSSTQGPVRVLVGGDSQPPRTSFVLGVPSMSSSVVYATNFTAFSLAAFDDLLSTSDGAGLGISQTNIALDTTTFSLYTGTFSFSEEGLHSAAFFSVDMTSHTESSQTVVVAIDTTPPVTALQAIGFSTTDSQGIIFITTATQISLSAEDPLSNGVASGLGGIYYVIDSNPFDSVCANIPRDASQAVGTCANESYAGAFTLTPGMHTIYFYAQDNLANHDVLHIASVTVGGPAAIQDLMANAVVYGSIQLSWTSPGELQYSGQALSFDLRFATSPITAGNFSSATAVTGLGAPPLGGSSSSFTVTGISPGKFYYFAIKTTNHAGQISGISNVLSVYSGDYTLALDSAGKMWGLETYPNRATLIRYLSDGQTSFNASLPWQSSSRTLGFDGDGNAYAFVVAAGASNDDPTSILTEIDPDGVFISSFGYRYISGQPAALNLAPDLQGVTALDSDGTSAWIAGDSRGYAGLWKADSAGISLAGLSFGATAQAVLANADGAVWMAGSSGELALWRYDTANDNMTRHIWTNTLGGTGSSGQSLIEDTDGNVWISGWAKTTAATVAALWRWDGTELTLIATSTGAFSDLTTGLELDDGGRFWVSGRTQVDSEGTLDLALWQYPSTGTVLVQSDLYTDYPPVPGFLAEDGLRIADGKLWVLDGPLPYGVHNRTLNLGTLVGTVDYPAGFTGGNMFFFTNNHVDFNNDVSAYGPYPAPSSGTIFNYSLTGLPAPATYYVAAAYDLSGSIETNGGPGSGDPLRINFKPVFLPSNGTASASTITIAFDQFPPTAAILSPIDGSTIPISLFTVNGTAADDTGIGEIQVGLRNDADGTWWDNQLSSFVASEEPITNLSAIRSGPANSFSWSVNMLNITPAITPGKAYSAYLQVSDIVGHTSTASATTVLMSTSAGAPVEPGYSIAFKRDGAGNLWTVTQDYIEDTPVGITLRKYDSAGAFLSTTSLPGAADDGGTYGLAFDPTTGDAWVAGAADESSGAVDLVLWKVSASNDVIFGTATITAPSGGSIYGGGIAVDASGNAWVSGAEQTSLSDFTFRLGLWKIDPFGSLAHTSYSQRSGGVIDGGFATAIDPVGNIWSAGISSNPATGLLDLALWKFDSAGDLLSVSYDTGAFLSVDNTGLGLAPAPGGGIWVSASHAYPQWGASDLTLLRYDASGVLISSALWHGNGADAVQGHSVALDTVGNPWVAGLTGPDASSIWKYTASGILAQGYPKRDSPDFDDAGIVVDPSGVVWASYAGEPFVFTGTTTIPGAPGRGPWSFANFTTISGTLTNPLGFVAGSTVTVLASSGSFRDNKIVGRFIATASATLPYSMTLLAPATYELGAFVGTDTNALSSATPIGFYNHFSGVSLSTDSSVSGADFLIYPDTTPPFAAFAGIVNASSLTALAAIHGTAADNAALDGTVVLSAQDLDNGLWWDAHKQDWVPSTTTISGRVDNAGPGGAGEVVSWTADARAQIISSDNFGGFSDFLPNGHTFRLGVQALDLVGNQQLFPSTVTFTWLGVNGATGPPSKTDSLATSTISATSVTTTWFASGEHQNIGTASSYDLRVATFPITATNFDSANAPPGLPVPVPAGIPFSYVINGLTPATRYYFALETVNHEGGISPLSNVISALTPMSNPLPRTTLNFGTPSFSTNTLYATDITTFSLTAADDLITVGDDSGPGITQTFVAIDTSTFGIYTGPFSFLGEGTHFVSYYSVDLATQTEVVKTSTVAVDLTAPGTTLSVLGSSTTNSQGILTITTGAALSLAAADPLSAGVASGVRSIFYVIDPAPTPEDCQNVPHDPQQPHGTCANELYDGPFTLSGGTHAIYFSATDNVGNRENVHVTSVTVLIDSVAPRTSLSYGGTIFSSSTLYATALSTFALTAVDDLVLSGDSAGLGVSQTFIAVDTIAFSVYSGTFGFASEGVHSVQFYSIDAASNTEVIRSTSIAIDLTPPHSQLQIVGASATGVSGEIVISSASPVTLSASDPISSGVASGVNELSYVVDVDPLSPECGDAPHDPEQSSGTCANKSYSGPFTLAPGTHTVYFVSDDNVGNQEIIQIASFTVPADTLSPRTSISAGQPSFSSSTLYASASTTFTLTAHDDLAVQGDNLGLGVSQSFISIDTASFSIYHGTFSLPSEGSHQIEFYSQDNIGNTETIRSTTVAADFTPPTTQLQVQGSSTADAQGRLVVWSGTPISLASEDPLSGGVASGLKAVSYVIDADPLSLDCRNTHHDQQQPAGTCANESYASTFTLVGGTHTVYFFSEDNAGNQESVRIASFTIFDDNLPPRTTLMAGSPRAGDDPLFVSSATPLALSSIDDRVIFGDGMGTGVALTFVSVDSGPFATYIGTFTLVTPGTHAVRFFSIDTLNNTEIVKSSQMVVDSEPPSTSLTIDGVFTASTSPVVTSTDTIGLIAVDSGAGVSQILYALDASTLTVYLSTFSAAVGTHTLYYQASDLVGNSESLQSLYLTVLSASDLFGSPYQTSPTTGPIGIPFSISGSSFGAYAGSNTRVKFGATAAPISVWNDTTIKGTIPGLSTGTYAVAIERQTGSTVTALSAGDFSVQLPSATAITTSSAPIGAPFSITGTGFGPYAGTRTLLLIGESTAPVSVWNDAKLSGTVPALSTGTYPVRVVRTTADGGVMTVTPFDFQVVAPAPDSFAPLSGPIGVPFTVTGAGFGPYAGANTRIVFDGVRAPVSVWNDSTIKGTIPGLSPGEHPVWIERSSSDGGLQSSDTGYFTVTVPSVTSVSPSSGPIGATFTLAGGSFGPYAGSLTRLLIGGTTAPVSVWNDSTIKATVPGTLTAGVQPVVVERVTTDGGLSDSATVYFQVLAPFGANLTPTAGPIGVPFTVTGTGFGAYAGANTLLVIGPSTAAVSVWNDSTISGTIPALATGTYSVAVERFQGTGMVTSVVAEFEVTPLVMPVPTPSSGPVGAPFTLLGSGFGPYAGTNTRLLLGGTTVAVSVWNDAQISGTVPTAAAGPQPLWIERLSADGLQSSDTVYFQVVVPLVTGVSPSSGPIGVAFTVTGSGFGPYAGSDTAVLIGGTTTPISVWNDSTIVGTVPGSLATGAYELTVARRAPDGGVVQSAPVSFQVTGMNLDDLAPTAGPIGVPFTIHGSQFGAYQGSNTRVRFGTSLAAVSVWNDSTISGTIPALATGTYSVAVERQQGSDVALSNAASFTVSDYSFTGLTPSSGPIGVPFTITGAGFGPYAGSNTRLLLGGTTVAVSVWNDGQITGTVPPVPPGSQPLWIERLTAGGVQSSDTAYFLVSVPTVETLTPSSAPIGAPFTLHGTSFGSYAGSNTRVKFGALLAPISVWNDSTISGTVPGAASTGAVTVVVERASGPGLTQSATQAFVVVAPSVSTMTPLSGPPGTVVTLSGSGFGPYAGALTTVLIGGSTVPVSVWNDATIHWTVPSSLADGTYPVLVVRSPAGGTSQSEPLDFTVGNGSGASALFATTSLALQPAVNFQGDLNLSTATGGRVQTPSQAAVEVPPGALDQDTEITVDRDRSTHKKDRENALEHDKLGSAGEAISFGPEGTRFAVPVTIELPYDPDLVPAGKLHELAVNYFDPTTKTWAPLDSQVDEVRHVVSARTSHFSLYQPLGHGIGVQAASAAFGFKAVYAYPNPVRGASAVTIRVQPGLADSVSVRVYDASGHKVHESSDFTVNPSFDDGNGLGAQYTYDHVWNVGGVGSGVYTYAVTAKKAGERDIHKTGRIGVVK